ncbi:sensor histidine kinase [Dactylosporangium sp. NPDC051541]|uniref:sensor histidine kinase n=1 Tax=Dactylosporangium sp. NPDC051541 TaxID=3363977 RepID=UPI0037BD6A13
MRWPRPLDAVFAVVLLAVGLLEVGGHHLAVDRPGPAAMAILAGTAAMLFRSQFPLACLAVFTAVVAVMLSLADGGALTAAVMIGQLVALGAVGQLVADRLSGAAVIVAVAALMVVPLLGRRPWDAMVLLSCSLAWVVGRLIRRETERNRRLTTLAAELAGEREARAREEVDLERARIARDLHDAVARIVSVMTVQAAGVRRRLDRLPDRSAERDVLLGVERLGREAVEELHRAVGVLRVPAAPGHRLTDLERLAAGPRAAGVPVSIRIAGAARPLAAGLETVAYRIVQEALTNTLKHAGPARVTIEVAYREDELCVSVRDDGAGPEADGSGDGHGLAGMRERAAVYGGTVHAGPDRDRGFAVRATFPLDRPG